VANPHRGEVSFTVGDATYTLKFGTNAWAEAEAATGLGTVAIIAAVMGWRDPEKISFGMFRKLMWAGLRKHHQGLTQEAVGDLIDEAGGFMALQETFFSAWNKAWPTADPDMPASPTNGRGTGIGLDEISSR
jgi:hypothetical protein